MRDMHGSSVACGLALALGYGGAEKMANTSSWLPGALWALAEGKLAGKDDDNAQDMGMTVAAASTRVLLTGFDTATLRRYSSGDPIFCGR